MKTKTVNLYQFDELSDTAKEKARQWWRECESQEFGSFGELTESAETAAKLLGIEFGRHDIPLHGGGQRREPKVWWQLHVQGSGASFEGDYGYARGSAQNIRKEFPTDTTLHAIADGLQRIQKRYAYKIEARIQTNSREVHKYAMSVDAVLPNANMLGENDENALLELMRDFADWIYKNISDEWDYRMADENVDDSMRANEYYFTEDGQRDD